MDPETGVLRPRDLSEHLSLEINRCQRMQLPMGVAAVLDTPQEAGAHADRRSAGRPRAACGENLRRYDDGGPAETGEFVAVLPDVSRSGLAAAAERLQQPACRGPGTVGAPRRMALAHLDCVDSDRRRPSLEQAAEALEHARTSDDHDLPNLESAACPRLSSRPPAA